MSSVIVETFDLLIISKKEARDASRGGGMQQKSSRKNTLIK